MGESELWLFRCRLDRIIYSAWAIRRPAFCGSLTTSNSNRWNLLLMKTQRLAIGLTVLNLVILMFFLIRAKSTLSPEVAPVLRGRALEIVDDQDAFVRCSRCSRARALP